MHVIYSLDYGSVLCKVQNIIAHPAQKKESISCEDPHNSPHILLSTHQCYILYLFVAWFSNGMVAWGVFVQCQTLNGMVEWGVSVLYIENKMKKLHIIYLKVF
jgi:hypothetical protein